MTRFITNPAGETEDTAPTAVDFLGQRYGVGDLVVYATTSGRSPVQKYARVVRIDRDIETRGQWDHGAGRRVNVQHVTLKVGVRQISNSRGFGWSNHKYVKDGDSWRAVPTETRVSYPTPDNIVKVASL